MPMCNLINVTFPISIRVLKGIARSASLITSMAYTNHRLLPLLLILILHCTTLTRSAIRPPWMRIASTTALASKIFDIGVLMFNDSPPNERDWLTITRMKGVKAFVRVHPGDPDYLDFYVRVKVIVKSSATAAFQFATAKMYLTFHADQPFDIDRVFSYVCMPLQIKG
ncbi:hypothetical protein AXF42_Ash010910 [Apostasia shenzhenica]|uniref:Uncharacterized protein n=1 Tax=Apostasia shenzhenica TaxID=1088818 RepID=A0A2I0A107_9ASPA|nr:hypothetical protein AXF42_Ash010910 [Apostasia shenzhenica]